MTFAEARASFPVLDEHAYLNAGSMGPLARPTHDAVTAEQRLELERGRGGPPFLERLLGLRQSARERMAALLGVASANVSLTSSTTDGCNIVLAGLDLGPGDEIVTTDGEHFGLLGPLHASTARVRVAPILNRPAEDAFDAVLRCVTPRTRLLALSHVSWMTGHRLPIGELKQETGLPMLVDGAQSAGAIEVAASPFDFYTASAQKWPCAPDGTGALYVAEPEALRVAAPSHFAQEGYEADGSFTPRAGAARFDPRWLPPAALAGLLAAIDHAPDWRFTRAAEMAGRCRERLEERFEVVTEPGHATLVTFRAGDDPEALVARAFERGVILRVVPRTDWLRASCGYWTNDEDIDRLVDALV